MVAVEISTDLLSFLITIQLQLNTKILKQWKTDDVNLKVSYLRGFRRCIECSFEIVSNSWAKLV